MTGYKLSHGKQNEIYIMRMLKERQNKKKIKLVTFTLFSLLTPHYKQSEPVNRTGKFHLRGHLGGLLAVDMVFLKEKFEIH